MEVKDVFKLSISDLRIWVRLGCGEEEKFHSQLVSFSLELDFKSLPKGATSDKLEDTICYLEIVEAIKAHCKNKMFNLIEHLTECVYQIITEFLSSKFYLLNSIKIVTHKVAPPVPDVHGGVSFTYCVHPSKNS